MTKKRKQELRQLLEEATGRLEVQPLPKDLYRKYLQERWEHFGLDRFSPSWIQPTLDIGSEPVKSRLLKFIREELAQFLGVDGDSITVAVYFIEHHSIEHHSTNGPRLNRVDDLLRTIDVDFILTRLLDIALVRGVEQAVSVFDICSRPEGSSCIFQRISVVKGLSLKRDIEVSRGIRLVPMPDSGISDKVLDYLPTFPRTAFRYEFPNFHKNTLLAIDCPGLSIFHKPGPNQEFPQGLPVADLPFKLEGHDVGYGDSLEVESFRESFSRALSLSVNFPVEIPRGGLLPAGSGDSHVQNGTFSIRPIREGLFLAEDRTFSPRHASIVSLIPASRFTYSTRADENHIEQAKCLYKSLVDFNAKDRAKLLIAIDRWIKSKSSGSEADAIIDVGIALEALYLSNIREPTELSFRLRLHAAWHLRENEKDRKDLMKEFREIYEWRSSVVHNGELPKKEIGTKSKKKKIPYTEEEVAAFIQNAQIRCRESIRKIVHDGGFRDWNSLILGGEKEEGRS